MATDVHQILKQYWGYDAFRPLQEDIIRNALAGRDGLALLPTGGGKSICFQVPVLAREGLGLVVSPLIALMNDQVQNLKKRGISAIAITSSMRYREIDLALDACVHGRYKFLYVSPERLHQDLFAERLKQMKVNLVAVDEAHCISQWGYDFRPAYLQIAGVRKHLPGVPVLALTATATPEVVEDIQEQLTFTQKRVFRQSFRRANLFYNLVRTENKWQRALDILQRTQGTAILYMRSRKGTVKMADWLQSCGHEAYYYHAGLSSEERARRQQAWLQDDVRIMVCTNAFGMGIDKPGVRLVLHLELPDSLEAYFQEAGRAGRDGQNAHAVILLGPADVDDLRRKSLGQFPDLIFIKKTYQALGNHLQIAVGTGENQTFPFDLENFVKQYQLPPAKTVTALDILVKEGLISLSDQYKVPSRIKLTVGRTALYDYQLRHPLANRLIKTLMRSYGGLELEYAAINETALAHRSELSLEQTMTLLQKMHERKIIDYLPQNSDSTVSYLQARLPEQNLSIQPAHLQQRYAALEKRVEAVCDYARQDLQCRSQVLLRYFGEQRSKPCGKCDLCRARKKPQLSEAILQQLAGEVLQLLEGQSLSPEEVAAQLSKPRHCRGILQWLLDEEQIRLKGGRLCRIR